jgi:AcrR family transcriptional regulator
MSDRARASAKGRSRLTNQERLALTRQRLLAAAATVFARRGYHSASVEEVAREGGYSTGAVYHHFKGKEDLFLALFEEHVTERIRDYAETFARGRDTGQQARGGADRWMAFLREEPDFFPLYVEFWAAAVRDPKLRSRFAARLGAFRDTFARQIEQGAEDAGVELPPGFAQRFGIVVNALGNGMALEKLVDPDGVPDELLGDALALIFEGLARLADPASVEKGARR